VSQPTVRYAKKLVRQFQFIYLKVLREIFNEHFGAIYNAPSRAFSERKWEVLGEIFVGVFALLVDPAAAYRQGGSIEA
jgi:hypothetical protein